MSETRGRSAHRPTGPHLTFTVAEAFRHGPEHLTHGREARERAAAEVQRKAAADAIRMVAGKAKPQAEAEALGLVAIHEGA